MRALSKVAGFFAVIALGGCKHDQQPPATEATVATATMTTTTKAQLPANAAVNLSADIVEQCKIQISNDPPRFDYDSSNLSSQERDILGQVAKCLTVGPLSGRSVKLTGRADPRGEQEYNMNLGEHRATSVRKYLYGLGVPESRMVETSRGALDATGTNEAGWEHDRRVDVSLQ